MGAAIFTSLCQQALLKLYLSVCVVGLTQIFGLDFVIIDAFIVLVFLDAATGLLVAIKKKKLSKMKFLPGVAKVFYQLCLIMATYYFVQAMKALPDIGGASVMLDYFQQGVIAFILAHEFISITENGVELGLPMPIWLKEMFASYHKQLSKKSLSKQ